MLFHIMLEPSLYNRVIHWSTNSNFVGGYFLFSTVQESSRWYSNHTNCQWIVKIAVAASYHRREEHSQLLPVDDMNNSFNLPFQLPQDALRHKEHINDMFSYHCYHKFYTCLYDYSPLLLMLLLLCTPATSQGWLGGVENFMLRYIMEITSR